MFAHTLIVKYNSSTGWISEVGIDDFKFANSNSILGRISNKYYNESLQESNDALLLKLKDLNIEVADSFDIHFKDQSEVTQDYCPVGIEKEFETERNRLISLGIIKIEQQA